MRNNKYPYYKSIPYTLPVWITGLFVLTFYVRLYLVGILLIPLVSFALYPFGKFTLQELKNEYQFFHLSKVVASIKFVSAICFIAFNLWVAYFFSVTSFTVLQLSMFLYGVIIINANFSISLAHDLMHSDRTADKFLSNVLLVLNGFFYLQSDHLFIHHKYMGTINDPASAREGEGLYYYLARSVPTRLSWLLGLKKSKAVHLDKKAIMNTYIKLVSCLMLLVVAYLTNEFFFYFC